MKEVMMQKQVISLFLMTLIFGIPLSADVIMRKKPRPPIPVHPIEPPIDRPIVHPGIPTYVDTAFVDNRIVNNNYESCDKYKNMIDELNAYIDQLEKQVAELKEKEFARMREKLKKKNEEELKKFENRKSSVKTINKIEIKSQ